MSKLTNIEIMARVWKITEANDWPALEQYFTPNTEFRMGGGQPLRGVREFAQLCQGWWGAFPDLKHEVTAELESGDSYACELAMHGTHTGTMHSPQGDLPATGKRVKMHSCDYVVIRDGKIVTWHAYPDIPGMMAQLTGG